MADEASQTSSPIPAHREPPPSLGMVAHIWAGHLGSLEVSDAAAAVEVVDEPGLQRPARSR